MGHFVFPSEYAHKKKIADCSRKNSPHQKIWILLTSSDQAINYQWKQAHKYGRKTVKNKHAEMMKYVRLVKTRANNIWKRSMKMNVNQITIFDCVDLIMYIWASVEGLDDHIYLHLCIFIFHKVNLSIRQDARIGGAHVARWIIFLSVHSRIHSVLFRWEIMHAKFFFSAWFQCSLKSEV